MDFVASIVVGFLSLYLGATQALADQVLALFPSDEPTAVVQTVTDIAPDTQTAEELTTIADTYEYGGSIPQVLIDNAAYQAAAISQAVYPEATATPSEALANILCTYRSENYERTTTGTGLFIHPDGIILTNAHVAMFLLLAGEEGDGECVIRIGDPATPAYTAELLYISPLWIRQNAAVFKEKAPKGTGERDYALLYVNKALNNQPLPRVFPALSFDTELLRTSAVDSEVTAAGYPAGNVTRSEDGIELTLHTATTTVAELMTFESNYADLMSLRGTVVGASGSSGGPVIDADGNAIGMIVTRGNDAEYGAGSLRALTISYIDRTITEETGFDLLRNLTGDLPYRSALYKTTMVPFLQQILRWELE